MTSTGDAVVFSGLTKTFGAVRALDDLTLAVPSGAIYGFLGPNGAGKTTAIRILLGMTPPTSGEARIFGEHVSASSEVRRRIGYAPDVPHFYPWMRGEEFLRYAGSLFGLRGNDLDRRVASLLTLSGLTGVTQKIAGYSRGMKQRLGIAQALVNSPELLLLDEPTSALDPLGRRDVLTMVERLRGKTTVVFSTHILSDVERVCDSVAILDHGTVVREGRLSEILGDATTSRYFAEIDGEAVAESLSALPCVRSVVARDGGWDITSLDAETLEREVPSLISHRQWRLRRFEPVSRTLEDVFVDVVRDRNPS